jgi:hypothetical protein
MPDHQGGERYTVELEAMPDDVPPVIRLRRWLKAALRSARFRALSVRDTTPALPPAVLKTGTESPIRDEKGNH